MAASDPGAGQRDRLRHRGPGLNVSGGDRPEQLQGIHVSHEFFRLFGARTALGRTFTEAEDRPGGGKLVVLSYGVWQRRFGSDPAVAGKAISLGGEPHTILGVLARDFFFDPPPDLYLPFQADPNSTNQGHYFRAAARLRPGVTLEAANAALSLAAEEFKRQYPGRLDPKSTFSVAPMQQLMVRNVRTALYVLPGAVGCVLLIACANIANLLLARASRRSREIDIRAALGAGRARIVRQLLTESLLLSSAGGALGLAIGIAGVRGLLVVNPGSVPRIGPDAAAVTLDATVLAFTLLLSLVTGVLFGLAPALHASRADLTYTLKETSARSGSSLRQNKARSLLIVAEMALAVVLLAGAGLLIRTFAALHSGLMAYSVEQRTLEFGIRLALGANSSGLRNMVVRQAMMLAAAGMAIGLAAAFGLTRLMGSLLFQVKPGTCPL